MTYGLMYILKASLNNVFTLKLWATCPYMLSKPIVATAYAEFGVDPVLKLNEHLNEILGPDSRGIRHLSPYCSNFEIFFFFVLRCQDICRKMHLIHLFFFNFGGGGGAPHPIKASALQCSQPSHPPLLSPNPDSTPAIHYLTHLCCFLKVEFMMTYLRIMNVYISKHK